MGTGLAVFATGSCAGIGAAIGTIWPVVGTAVGASVGTLICGIPAIILVVSGVCISAFISVFSLLLAAGSAIAKPIVSLII
jgi:hypothetical protein